MKRTVVALAVLILAACASAPTTGTPEYVVSHKPPDYVVVYISSAGTAHPDPAWLDIDSTKKQTLFFIADGNDLRVVFKDADNPFKVDCSGRMCMAKIDKPHKDLYEYHYGFRFTDASGNPVERDPIVIIDTVETLFR